MSENYYSILNVTDGASQDEIKKAYRQLSLKYHPDKNPNDPSCVAKFQKITEAYETLGDSERRREYDMMQKNPFFKMGTGTSAPPDMSDIFSNIFFHQAGGNPFQSSSAGSNPFQQNGGNPFMHFFAPGGMGPNVQLFHNGIPINLSNNLRKPTPIVKTVNISIEQVLTGVNLPIEIERWVIEDGNKIFEKETIYIDVPKGVDTNEIQIIENKGNVVNNECKGDIKIIFEVKNDTEFRRSGLDLYYTKKIKLKEALCGFRFEFKHITGKTYIINNKDTVIGIGYKRVFSKMGITRHDITGNLIIEFEVIFPEKIESSVIDELSKLDF